MKHRFEHRQDVAYERQTDRIVARQWDNARYRLAILTSPVWSMEWRQGYPGPGLVKSARTFADLSLYERRTVVERRSRERRP